MFLNPIMLIGLGAAVIPLLLHLLSRARYRDVEWGGMMFLDSGDPPRRQTARFSQLLLLLVRTAMIVLLALALARPVAQGRWAGAASEGRVTAVLILDCSASMGFNENGRTRFQMAQAAARQIIRGLRPGDRLSLILTGAPATANDLEPTGDLRAIEARIDDARIGHGRASLHDALDAAADVLHRDEKAFRDLYIVSDRQALSWEGIDARFAADWKQRVGGVRMFVLPIGSADADNVAVDSVNLLNPPAIVGQQVDMEVVVHNYGPVSHTFVPVTLEGEGLSLPERTISVAPGQTATVPFSVAFNQTGSQVLTARLKSAGYTSDDQMDVAVNVIAPIRVLVVSGDERSGQYHNESDFLRWALAPHRSASVSGADPCVVTVVPADAWNEGDLNHYQVVVLANVERFLPAGARAIEKYVYSGGRLLVAPGSLSRIDDYNALLYREGAGVLPALLGPATAADGSQATSLLGFQTDHPIFQFLRGRFEIPSATIVRYFPAVPRQVDAHVLARYLSNDPFLIEGGEHGRVLLMTTALDADWSTLPLTNFYLPFMQSMIRYLAGGAVARANLSTGEPIRLMLDEGSATRTVTLTRPDGRVVQLDIVRLETQPQIRYEQTDLPGTYKVVVQERGKPARSSFFIVRPPRDESDLRQLEETQWHDLEQKLGFSRIDPVAKPVTDTVSPRREGRELWGWVLAAVLGLFVIELLVARLGVARATKPAPLAQELPMPHAPATEDEPQAASLHEA